MSSKSAAICGPQLPDSTDVFVVGGGPAGLAAAIAARQRGMDVVVADGARGPIDKACGEGIMPDGLAAARALGIHIDPSIGKTFCGIRFASSSGSTRAEFPNGIGLGVRRTALHTQLTAHALDSGVRLAHGTNVTGVEGNFVHASGRSVRARWVIGADGGQSRVRSWAGLEGVRRESLRYGFRRHYQVEEAPDFMELHWDEGCQLYITPVAPREICLVVISRDPHLRLDQALPRFPEVQGRLAAARIVSAERGGVSITRRLRRVYCGHIALLGDASGSVDAITGEGLCLLFQQAAALANALESNNLPAYQTEHRRIGRRPEMMSELMLLLDRHRGLREHALGAMFAEPGLFSRMLSMHVGALSPLGFLSSSLSLGWRMLMVNP